MEEHQEYNARLFRTWAPFYDAVVSVFGLNRIRKRVSCLIEQPSKILDVACGTGSQAVVLAGQGHDVTGIDLSPDMLREAKAKSNGIKFVLGDVTRLPFKARTFDVSMISFGLHDMPLDIRVNVLKEMKRVTRKKGKIIVVDYHESKHWWARAFMKHLLVIFESRYYPSFMSDGLDKYLNEIHLSLTERYSLSMDCVQVVVSLV